MSADKTNMNPNGYELVYVEWLDSTSPDSGWTDANAVVTDPMLDVVSVGWILESTDRHLAIAAHIHRRHPTEHRYNVEGSMVIPKVAITMMKVLSAEKPSDEIQKYLDQKGPEISSKLRELAQR